ncbi:hypothetical protein PV735_11035 [Streptomyces turgidiscabies]|uniref:Putative membrane protein n=1 Tax=Streptomyces turgidiscabies (strain Car8) TaxID=698760 RepID=L7F1K3_STRT8|nr:MULTISPECIES: hypothetical protein [Streptomyces]ELP65528.1 putative membrane protein [Streptomyces turgidiscabies Car8]MDX3493221.1 hypothetical protein [Streptomyces turgidiscabies]
MWHERHRVALTVTAFAVPLYFVWWAVFATGGGDLAAQVAWAEFAKMYPDSAYNLFWYGGLHAANYSLMSPYLMAAIGVVAATMLSGVAATLLGAELVARTGVRKPLWPALAVGFSLWCQVISGRSTFVLGTAFGMAAVLAVVSGRGARNLGVAAVCATLATTGSPVAGLFVLVVGAAYFLSRDWGRAAALLVPPVAVVGVTTLLFPFEGEQPMPFSRIWLPVVLCAIIVLTAPSTWRTLRLGAAVYAAGVVLCYLIPTPIGTNVERLSELAAPATLLAIMMYRTERRQQEQESEETLGEQDGKGQGDDRLGEADAVPRLPLPWFTARRRMVALGLAMAIAVSWLSGKTLADIVTNTTVPEWAVKTDGVVNELKRLGAEETRVEVVPARDHREAAILAPYINMARGWNRQADVERGRLFYEGHAGTAEPEGGFTPAAYKAWLSQWAVGFVVLVNGEPDGPAKLEHALVTSGPSYLQPVWEDANWKIYRVKNATPLVDKPASVISADGANMVVRMPKAGEVTVRIAYSPWLWAENGCLTDEGEFTKLTVEAPGDIRISSTYGGPSRETTLQCEKEADADN